MGSVRIGLFLLALTIPMGCRGVEQPTSTVLEDAQYILFGNIDPDHFKLTTLELPYPRNPRDVKVGDPRYHWDFGPLHAASYTPGVLSVYADTDGSYEVTVYCEQIFQDAHGDFYCECTSPDKAE